MPKNKPNKGLKKRIRFTKSGRIKFGRAFGRHLRSHKSRKLKRSYRKPAYAKSTDAGRVRAMLFTRVVSAAQVEAEEAEAASAES
jgi:large subunit ribosomal protein L35